MGDDEQTIVTADGTTTRGELRQRVTVLAPGIVLIREYPKASAATWDFMARTAAAVGETYDVYVVVLDVSEAVVRPKGAYLETIRHTLSEVLKPAHIAFVQPGSMLLRSVLRFIANTIVRKSTVHASLEEALVMARSALDEAQRDQAQREKA